MKNGNRSMQQIMTIFWRKVLSAVKMEANGNNPVGRNENEICCTFGRRWNRHLLNDWYYEEDYIPGDKSLGLLDHSGTNRSLETMTWIQPGRWPFLVFGRRWNAMCFGIRLPRSERSKPLCVQEIGEHCFHFIHSIRYQICYVLMWFMPLCWLVFSCLSHNIFCLSSIYSFIA